MTRGEVTALIAGDEPLLREALERQLAAAGPELQVVARARDGREAVELLEQHRPTVCFLDVQMPGLLRVDAARQIGDRGTRAATAAGIRRRCAGCEPRSAAPCR
jgi:CheY-like chemotaxis protein